MRQEERFSVARQITLIALRTVIGWHFLYEGYYKLALPAWSAEGIPLGKWSAASYLKAVSGPLAKIFQWLLNKGWGNWIDNTVKVSLLLIGLSLLLGLFTKWGGLGALFFLALFYFLAIPLAGTHQFGDEGNYLIVNKNLIEAAAVCVLLAFSTEKIAGLDLLLSRKSERQAIKIGSSQTQQPL